MFDRYLAYLDATRAPAVPPLHATWHVSLGYSALLGGYLGARFAPLPKF